MGQRYIWKFFVFAVLVFFVVSMISFAIAKDKNSNNSGRESSERENENDDKKDNESEIEDDDNEVELEKESENGTKIKIKIGGSGTELRLEAKNIRFRVWENGSIQIISGNISALIERLNISLEDIGNWSNGMLLRAFMSNGKHAYLRVMPDEASDIALSKFKADCEEDECELKIKEVGRGNYTTVVYYIEADIDSKFLWLFERKMKVKAEINAEDGEIVYVKKPWWGFLARTGIEKKVTICHKPDERNETKNMNGNTITISKNALKAHLAHGDYVGRCGNQTIIGNNTNGTIIGNNTNVSLGITLVKPENNSEFNTAIIPIEFVPLSLTSVNCYYILDSGNESAIAGCQNTTITTIGGNHSIYLRIREGNNSAISNTHDFSIVLPIV